jgi:hypothetical protein
MCAQDPTSFYKPVGFSYTVQRTWSNQAAAAGKDPCQPAIPNSVYFTAVPVLADAVTLNASGQTFTTKGVKMSVGQSKTVEVDLFSEGPHTAWNVQAFDYTQNGEVSFSLNRTSGANGDKLMLSITRNKAGSVYGTTPFVVISYAGQTQHMYFGVVGD